MGGKSSKGNDAVVQEQAKEAAQARADEEARKARVQQGMTSIKQAFEGAPVMGTKNVGFDWSSIAAPTGTAAQRAMAAGGATSPFGASTAGLQGSALPAGFEWVQTAAPAPAGGPTSALRNVNPNRPAVEPFASRPGLMTDPSHPGYSRAANQNVYVGGDSGKDAGGLVWTGNTGGAAGGRSATPGGGQVWAIKGPDGKIHYQGDAFNYDTSYDTGQRTGGFDDAFYGDYRKGIVDYYQPQVQKQYQDAKKELTYRLARAGTLRSSMAADETADLSNQYDLNTANVLNKADQGAADLRGKVASERAKTEGQLLASEDPNAAASQALTAVRDISLDQPTLSPLSALFNLATIGAAGGMRGYQNQRYANAYQPIGRSASKQVG